MDSFFSGMQKAFVLTLKFLLFFLCSGGQNITITGRNFDVIDNLIISHELKGNINVSLQLLCNHSYF